MKRFLYWLNERAHLRNEVAELELKLRINEILILKAAENIQKERTDNEGKIMSLQVQLRLEKDKAVGVS